MTKEEFVGLSSAAQHDMVLEALVRVTKNCEIMEKASGKPFAGTSKQNANDIKLLTILADAFCKNELLWDYARMYRNGNISESNYKARYDECMARGSALFTGIGQQMYMEKSKEKAWKPLPESMRRGNTKPVVGVVGGEKRMTVEEYVKENIKESQGKYYGK